MTEESKHAPSRLSVLFSVQDLASFIGNTELGLVKTVTDGDYGKLVEIMGHLMAIRDRQLSTEQHFKPLKATADLLKTYNQQLPEHNYILMKVIRSQSHNTFTFDCFNNTHTHSFSHFQTNGRT